MWIEVLDRHGSVVTRHRFDDIARWPVRIGRAPDNDIVLDDPHVAPHHAQISMDRDGNLHVDDEGTLNGLINESTQQRQARILCSAHPLVRLGRTRLRVRDGREHVAPELPLVSEFGAVWIAAGLAVMVLAFGLLDLWLSYTGDKPATHFLLPMMGLTVLLLVWTSAWALDSRIFAGQSWYVRHLCVALLATLTILVTAEAMEWLAYGLAAPTLQDQESVSIWIIIAVASYAHCRIIGMRQMRLVVTAIVLALVAVLGMQWATQHEAVKWVGQPARLGTLKPPVLQLAPSLTMPEFVKRTNEMRTVLETARRKEPERDDLDGDN